MFQTGSFPALFSASLALNKIDQSKENYRNSTSHSVLATKIGCGWVIATAIVALVVMGICILIQIVHSKLLTEHFLRVVS